MTQLLVATRNRGKQAEFRSLLKAFAYDIVFPDDLGLAEQPEESMLEVHDDYLSNARAKAIWFFDLSGVASLADDSGLEIDALGGRPGPHSKRFAGLDGPDHLVTPANNAHMVQLLHDVPLERRSARYRSVLVLTGLGIGDLVAEGTNEGRILLGPRGTNGFGYDSYFYCDELGMTFGEASPAEKAAVSHRARAVAALKPYI